jgi:hypothetical protein
MIDHLESARIVIDYDHHWAVAARLRAQYLNALFVKGCRSCARLQSTNVYSRVSYSRGYVLGVTPRCAFTSIPEPSEPPSSRVQHRP